MCDQVVKGKSISLEKKSVRISDCRNLNQKDVWLVCKEPYGLIPVQISKIVAKTK
jgi:hypothetical protein